MDQRVNNISEEISCDCSQFLLICCYYIYSWCVNVIGTRIKNLDYSVDMLMTDSMFVYVLGAAFISGTWITSSEEA